jgi:hypothetical protein
VQLFLLGVAREARGKDIELSSRHRTRCGLDGSVGTSRLCDDYYSVSRQADPFARKVVTYSSPVPLRTIVIDPANHFLYLVQSGGQAIRYGVGVGGEGFGWSGKASVHTKQEWPDWYPPAEMLQRDESSNRDQRRRTIAEVKN